MNEEEKKRIDEFDEATTYFFIDLIGGIIWRTNHDAGHGRVVITPEMQAELTELSEQQQYCVSQLGRFGIDPESAKNRPDGDYWKWFKHWNEWHHNMSSDEWYDLDKKMTDGEDYSAFLPKHKWNEKPQE